MWGVLDFLVDANKQELLHEDDFGVLNRNKDIMSEKQPHDSSLPRVSNQKKEENCRRLT